MATGLGNGRRLPRARGEGSILFYKGRWRVRIRRNGNESTWWANSERAARVLLRDRLRAGVEWGPGRVLTLDAWLDEWLAQMAMARPRTQPFYRQKLAHVRGKLGKVCITEIDARCIRLALADLQCAGMSPTMLHHVYRSLSAALNAAVAEQLLSRNPCQGITAPRRAEFEAITLTVDQSQRLLVEANRTKYGPLLTVALSTGMRAGELLALTWADVDFDHGLIRVNKSVKWQSGGNHVAGSTKTRSSRRTIAVGDPALRALVHQHAHCRRSQLQALRWVDNDLVFPSIHGTFWVPQGRFVRDFRALLSRAGCPQIRFHDLRHTAGLFLTRSVGVVVASRILGHSTPTITTTFYGHAQPEDFRVAAKLMGDLLEASP